MLFSSALEKHFSSAIYERSDGSFWLPDNIHYFFVRFLLEKSQDENISIENGE